MTRIDRRALLRSLAGIATFRTVSRDAAAAVPLTDHRGETALRMRQSAAAFQCLQPPPHLVTNGDETSLPGFSACFSKGLPHDASGLVDAGAYGTLLNAVTSGSHADFESIRIGAGARLVNPEAGFTFSMEGADSQRLPCPPPPALASAEAAAEMVELYWQATARDVPFTDYATSPLVRSAAAELNTLNAFRGPRSAGAVTPDVVFRGTLPGCNDGPYLSQFLWKPVPTLSTWVDQRYRVPYPGSDFLTSWGEWLQLRNGNAAQRQYLFDSTPRYLSNARGLAEYVHYDFLYQAFHNAALILLNYGPDPAHSSAAFLNSTNPYTRSRVQSGFATFGPAQICGWLGRVTTAALQAVWYQKWAVHRRLRPEEYGGLLHQTLSGGTTYPLSPELLHSDAVHAAYQRNGSYLLPQAFPEGCPLHPSFPAGHATVAAACATLLKAFFDESAILPDPVIANADGTALQPYAGAPLTLGGEIHKLAFNIAMARNFAGIHYRSDAMAGFRLGEDVAIAVMQDLVNTFTEDFGGFRFTRMDGAPLLIAPGQEPLVTPVTGRNRTFQPL